MFHGAKKNLKTILLLNKFIISADMTYLNKISLQKKHNRRVKNEQMRELLQLKELVGEIHSNKKDKMPGNSKSRRSNSRAILIQENTRRSRKSGKYNAIVE